MDVSVCHLLDASIFGQEIEYTDKYNMAAKLKRRYGQQVVAMVSVLGNQFEVLL